MTLRRLFPLIRKIAIITGFFPVVFFIVFMIGEGFAQLFDGKLRVLPILILMILSVSGYILAWKKRYRTGGMIMISGGLAMGIYLLFLGGLNDLTMALVFSIPFLIPGLLLIIASEHRPTSEVSGL